MICFGDVFCTSNVQEALCHLMRKADTIASDGMRIGDLESYWELNGSSLVSSIIDGKYYPSVVKNYEITNSHGKRRTVSNQGAVDRLICRMLSQVFQKRMDSLFSDRCFAYRPGKGVQKAVEMARTYVGAGKSIVVSIDIKDFFDSISIEVMMSKLKRLISDKTLLVLIERYM